MTPRTVGVETYGRGAATGGITPRRGMASQRAAGVVSAPALGSRWSAAKGGGARRDGDAVTVSKVAHLEDAHLAYDSVDAFESVGLEAEFLALEGIGWK